MGEIESSLAAAIARVPAGRWGVAVSGGADSVALLRLVCERSDIEPHVIHLDHETRDGGSAADAAFVQSLAESLHLPVSVARRSEVDAGGEGRNRSAIYRAARLAWFEVVVRQSGLAGVLLAHHADDQAETVAQRLLRGRQPAGLRGMSTDVRIGAVRLLRPLLPVPRETLRQFLLRIGQPWVEDPSNAAPTQQRNRLRGELARQPEARDALLRLAAACERLGDWLSRTAPVLTESFACHELAGLPKPLARRAAARWLALQGVVADELTAAICDRLIILACDSAESPLANFPGGITLQRCRGRVGSLRSGGKIVQHMPAISVLDNVSAGSEVCDHGAEATE